MKANGLGELYFMEKEIEMWERELKRLNKEGSFINQIERIGKILSKLKYEYNKRLIEIKKIDDPLLKEIIYYRLTDYLTWNEISQILGGSNNENNLKKIYSRYLLKEKSKKTA